MKSVLFLSAVAVSWMGSIVRADFDALPYIFKNQIVTGGHDDELGTNVDNLRVFPYAFGDVQGDPYNIGDPGFNTNGQSAFTPASQLIFTGLTIGGADLKYWNGNGLVNFDAAVPSGVMVQLAGSPTRNIQYTATSIAYTPTSNTNLLIGSFSSLNGALHIHLGSSIFENGDQTDGSVANGAYLISYTLQNPGTGVLDSNPLYIVYGNNLTDEQLDSAVDYVNAAYVPDPASTSLLITGLLGLLRGRRWIS